MPPSTVTRLDQALRFWEDNCFLLRAVVEIARGEGRSKSNIPIEGPLLHARELREHLLHAGRGAFDRERFVGPDDTRDFINKSSPGGWIYFPAAIKAWMDDSRRVFKLEESLQALLANTSLEGMTWNDVRWPFESFAITLGTPLQDSTGNEFDCLLVGHHINPVTGEMGRTITAFQNNLEELRPLGQASRDLLRGAIAKKKWLLARNRLKALDNHLPLATTFTIWLDDNESGDIQITEAMLQTARDGMLNPAAMQELPVIDQAFQLVITLCLYLTSLRPTSKCRSAWHQAERQSSSPYPGGITRESQVCTISSSYTLNREEQKLLLGGRTFTRLAGAKKPHFRRGFFRREPGRGNDPDAPRIVWVHPALVRQDRLTEGAVPDGSETVLK